MDPSPSTAPVYDDEPTRLLTVKPTARAFGNYELILKMGAGGMATLYLGRATGPDALEKFVAIKKIHDHLTDEQHFVDMFLDEARISSKINHPNVVEVYELGRIDDAYFISMEYVHGHDFSQLLSAVYRSEAKFLGWPIAAEIVRRAADGLHAAHELTDASGENLGVVHRDVSPQNILIGYDGTVKVVDFGIALAAERLTHTSTGTVKGKLSYMSPEQATGKPVDRRTDVFALGILLYESVCMRRLFRGKNDAITLQRLLDLEIPRPSHVVPGLPRHLEAVMLKALSRKPEERYATAAELSDALQGTLTEEQKRDPTPQIADLMQELFGNEKTERDADIHIASQETVLTDITAKVSQRADGDEDAEGPRRGRRRKGVAFGLVGVLLVAALVAGVLLLTGREKDQSAAKPGQPAKPPPSERIRLTLLITPKHAAVHINGVEIPTHQGENRRPLKVRRAEQPVTVVVSAKGYASKESRVLPVQDQTLSLALERTLAPAVTRPRPGMAVMKRPPRRRRWRPRPRPPRRRTGMRGGVGAVMF